MAKKKTRKAPVKKKICPKCKTKYSAQGKSCAKDKCDGAKLKWIDGVTPTKKNTTKKKAPKRAANVSSSYRAMSSLAKDIASLKKKYSPTLTKAQMKDVIDTEL